MIPLYSARQTREADSYAINVLGIPSIVLMENAARSIYTAIREFAGTSQIAGKIVIICGKGNNGGDGFALARHFINEGSQITVISLGGESELKGDALTNFRITRNLLSEYPASSLIIYSGPKDLSLLDDCSIIVDAMLGTGTRGDLGEPYKDIVEKANQINALKIAVDLPTGLDLESAGGSIVFGADLTVTLSEYKTGLFYGKGYVNCGRIVKGSIGIGEEYYNKLQVDQYLIEPEDAFNGIPEKKLDAHKYSAGKVLVIGGSGKLPGAAIFSANAVLRSGAGASFLAFPDSMKRLAQAKLSSSIVFPYNDEGKEFLSAKNIPELENRINWADIIAVGPGLGREKETNEAVVELIRSNKTARFVLDADALPAIGNGEYKKLNLRGKILTPHHKEFASLIEVDLELIEKNITGYGKEFSIENGCYLVLKGAPTIIFNPAGEVFINSTGNPGMAKFGSGDVLTGVISGFLAQTEEIEDALISAVYIHSLAADLLLEEKTEYGYTSEDLIEKIPDAIKFILKSFIE